MGSAKVRKVTQPYNYRKDRIFGGEPAVSCKWSSAVDICLTVHTLLLCWANEYGKITFQLMVNHIQVRLL